MKILKLLWNVGGCAADMIIKPSHQVMIGKPSSDDRQTVEHQRDDGNGLQMIIGRSPKQKAEMSYNGNTKKKLDPLLDVPAARKNLSFSKKALCYPAAITQCYIFDHVNFKHQSKGLLVN